MLMCRVGVTASVGLGILLGCAARNRAPSPAEAPTSESPEPSPAAAAPATATAPVAFEWLTVDSAGHSVSLDLEVTNSAEAPSALINGYRDGGIRMTVPVAWTIKWSWHNVDTAAPHSLVVMVQREKLPLEGGRPAFSNAMTRMVTEGLPPGGTDQSTFVAEEAGWYWLMCGVAGHALAGEWLELRIAPDAKTAAVEVRKR
jgi:hypothetical protein